MVEKGALPLYILSHTKKTDFGLVFALNKQQFLNFGLLTSNYHRISFRKWFVFRGMHLHLPCVFIFTAMSSNRGESFSSLVGS